jgi:hypothetical protein
MITEFVWPIRNLAVAVITQKMPCAKRAASSQYSEPIYASHVMSVREPVAQSVQCLTADWTAGVRSPTEDLSSALCVQTGSGAHPASCTVGTGGSFPRGAKRGRGVMLTTHPLLVPRSRKSRSCTTCHPNAPLWSVTGPLYLFL